MRWALLIVGGLAALAAFVASPAAASSAAGRSWPPFALVIGLLLVGLVAHRDGLFERAAAATSRLGGGGLRLLLALLGVVATVTAVLNLDTSVAFLTPILVLSARRRGLAESPFLFGSLFMANAASLLLPGSNLTNLLVRSGQHLSGARFAAQMAPAWLAAVVATALVLAVRYRHALSHPGSRPADQDQDQPRGRGLLGAGATAVAAALVLGLPAAALPVLVVGAAAVSWRLGQRQLGLGDVRAVVDLVVLAGLFGLVIALGTLAARWSGPANLLQSAGRWQTATIGALGAVLLNNLPAAMLFSARAPAHPRALLIGLNLGPNLAVTGSLSALLWFQAARTVGSRPSLGTVTRIGVVLVPCSILAALAVTRA